jgi:hypothetical protein
VALEILHWLTKNRQPIINGGNDPVNSIDRYCDGSDDQQTLEEIFNNTFPSKGFKMKIFLRGRWVHFSKLGQRTALKKWDNSTNF